MNQTQLKFRSTHLMTQLLKYGFSCNGKNPSEEQVMGLIAAQEGFISVEALYISVGIDRIPPAEGFSEPVSISGLDKHELVELATRWGDEHPVYQRAKWTDSSLGMSVKLFYWEWVLSSIRTHGGYEAHCENCGIIVGPGGKNGNSESFDESSLNPELAESEFKAKSHSDFDQRIADSAFANYDFGESSTVGAVNGWETTSHGQRSSIWLRDVFLAPNDASQGSKKVKFCVVIQDKTLIEAKVF